VDEKVKDLVAAASDRTETIDAVSRLKLAPVLTDVQIPDLTGASAACLFAEVSRARMFS
jgi:hypothetical protein